MVAWTSGVLISCLVLTAMALLALAGPGPSATSAIVLAWAGLLGGAASAAVLIMRVRQERTALITQREEVTDKLREAQAVGKIGWWRYDFRNDRIEASQELHRIFGVPSADFPTTTATFLGMVVPEDREMVQANLANAVRNRDMIDVTYRANVLGQVKYIHQRAELEFTHEGLATSSFGTIQDVTEARSAERDRETFVSTVSHELRTPLTSIIGALGLLRGGAAGALSDKAGSTVEIAYENGQRMLELVNDILDSEMLMAGEMEMEVEELDPENLLEDAVAAMACYGSQLGVTYSIRTTVGGLTISADRTRLQQVLVNLLSNAAKFSDEGSKVFIDLSVSGDDVVIAVEDHGEGIPEAAQAMIFERFTQAHGSHGRNVKSSGLGLSIARGIVEQHDGRMEFSSEEGRGSTFFVYLPARRVRVEEAAA